jgi:HEAT repeat protein
MELRRSAAISLGGHRNPVALPVMLAAFEREDEPVTRGFLLVSIGRQGGDSARDFLRKALAKGNANVRPWAAIGLGLCSRASDDQLARDVLRAAIAVERNHEVLPAYWLASGLARDVDSVDRIAQLFPKITDPWHRTYAATALALIGDDRAHAALLARAAVEPSPLARVAILQALGYLGRPEDAPRMIEILKSLREPELEALAAIGMGFHGTSEALSGLSSVISDAGTPSAARAAAFDGLGILLGRSEPFELSRATRNSNYTLYESWLDEVFQVTL